MLGLKEVKVYKSYFIKFYEGVVKFMVVIFFFVFLKECIVGLKEKGGLL